MTIRYGFFDAFKKESGGDDWKEQQYQVQQEILRKRRENDGFLSDEALDEIEKRRRDASKESSVLRKLQNKENGADVLDEWKKLRADGTITTATKGLIRDKGSSRLGSEGLFAERIDEKLPYIDTGYVDEKSDFMANLSKLFGGLNKKSK